MNLVEKAVAVWDLAKKCSDSTGTVPERRGKGMLTVEAITRGLVKTEMTDRTRCVL
jgi:hypothetical protein